MPDTKNKMTDETTDQPGVSLRAVDVMQQTFAIKFRGYDTLDVDSFLEIVAREIERLGNQNMKMIEDLRAARQELLLLRKKEDNVNAALLTVQKLAGDVQQKARVEADGLLEEARNKAREIVENAQEELRAQREEIPRLRERADEEARALVSEARQEAERIREDMQREKDALQDELTVLKQQKLRFEASFHALIETHLKLMEENEADATD
jgi:cell division initiation protein